MKSSSLALIVAILALLLGGALYFYDQGNGSLQSASSENDSVGNLDSSAAQVFVSEPSRIELTPIYGYEASAVSNRLFHNGKFILTVNADLPVNQPGYFYQVWVENTENQGITSLGKLEEEGGSYYLEHKNEKDLSALNKIIITKENIFDDIPEGKIMEGTF